MQYKFFVLYVTRESSCNDQFDINKNKISKTRHSLNNLKKNIFIDFFLSCVFNIYINNSTFIVYYYTLILLLLILFYFIFLYSILLCFSLHNSLSCFDYISFTLFITRWT